MKIGIYHARYTRFGEECYRKMKAHGFSCVDFGMADTETPLYAASEEEFREMLLHEKQLAEEAGMEINQVHGPWRWPPRDRTPEDQTERMEKMKKSIRGTAILGCKNWVIHPIMPFDIHDKGTENEPVTWEMNLAFMKELLAYAKEYDVTICLENMPMPEFSIGSPSEILKFVKQMNDEHFKICLDTGHVALYRDVTPGQAMRDMGSEVRVLHVHDNNGWGDIHQFPYFGVIDWDDFMRALKECGFEGVFSLETAPGEGLPDDIFEEMSRTLAKLAHRMVQ